LGEIVAPGTFAIVAQGTLTGETPERGKTPLLPAGQSHYRKLFHETLSCYSALNDK